jgi:hypothetical protein
VTKEWGRIRGARKNKMGEGKVAKFKIKRQNGVFTE